MLFTPQAFIGIDPSRGRKAIGYAAIDQNLDPITLSKGTFSEVVTFVRGQQQAVVGVVGPAALNQNILVDRERRDALLIPLSRGRPGDMRVAEYLLRKRGLPVYRTASVRENNPAWMETSLELHQKLAQLGYTAHGEPDAGSHIRLEVVPEVCFRVWLEGEVLPPNSTFGRLQRQMALFDLGVNIPDPMDFFEEVTRYKVLQGQMPDRMIYPTLQVYALAAAFLAWQVKNEPGRVTRIGVPGEGFITFPAERD